MKDLILAFLLAFGVVILIVGVVYAVVMLSIYAPLDGSIGVLSAVIAWLTWVFYQQLKAE